VASACLLARQVDIYLSDFKEENTKKTEEAATKASED
jgi:uncharacterized Fe-S radical SAM superfamily protein PflX